MPEWVPVRVEERLREAMVVRTLLSETAPVPEAGGTIGCIGIAANLNSTASDVVCRTTEALSWLRWLAPDDADLVMARIDGASWKSICWRFDISRPTADRRWRYALALMAWRLSGQVGDRTPSMRSLLPEFGKARCETSPGGTRPVLIGDLRTGNWSR